MEMVLNYMASEMDDIAIVRAFQGNGDRNAATQALYRRYYDRLVTHSFYIVHSREQAEDIVQNALGLKFPAHAQSDRFQITSLDWSLQSWLYSVVRTRSFNYLRDQKRRNHLLSAEGASELYDVDYERIVGMSTKRDVIETAMVDLTDDHQEVIRLFYFLHLPEKEIANQLKIKVGTVATRLNRAKISLRAAIYDKGLEKRLTA